MDSGCFRWLVALTIFLAGENSSVQALLDLTHINSLYRTACLPAVTETIITPFHATESIAIPGVHSFVRTTSAPVVETIPYTIHTHVETPNEPFATGNTFLSVPAVDAHPATAAGATQGVVKAVPEIGANVPTDATVVTSPKIVEEKICLSPITTNVII